MVEKNKKEKVVNIYEMAGKIGKEVRKYKGYILVATGTFIIAKGSDLIKKIKK